VQSKLIRYSSGLIIVDGANSLTKLALAGDFDLVDVTDIAGLY
jgi:hypothetical protein